MERRASFSGFNETGADRVPGQLGNASHVELCQQLVPVAGDGIQSNAEDSGNLFVSIACCNQAQDLRLPPRECLGAAGGEIWYPCFQFPAPAARTRIERPAGSPDLPSSFR